jgi:hypothetical protein
MTKIDEYVDAIPGSRITGYTALAGNLLGFNQPGTAVIEVSADTMRKLLKLVIADYLANEILTKAD